MTYAVVTGATQGIGRAITEKLLSEGVSVLIASRNLPAMQDLQQEWTLRYPTAPVLIFHADLSMPDEVFKLSEYIRTQLPEVNILVNNAGSFQPGQICDERDGQLEDMLRVNLFSAYNLTRRLLPMVNTQGTGHIFNMCSVASLRAYPNGGSYSIAKYALLGFSDNLREELMTKNIRVTALCPGATYTPSWAGSGVSPERIMAASDVADILWATYQLSASANIDRIVMRPVKGDL